MRIQIFHDAGEGDVSSSSREVKPRTSPSTSSSPVEVSQNSFSRFAGRSISDILIIEIFAGTARLSITAREAGFRCLAVDKTRDRCKGAHIAIFDLTKQGDVDSLKQLIHDERLNIALIHWAPACGTASRAREKRIPSLEAKGIAVPKPLRSDSEPLGLSSLQGVDKLRVEAANTVYYNTCALIRYAYELGIASSLENPANSIFWIIPFVAKMIEDLGGYDTIFHNCCHGGLRKKLTRFWDTHHLFPDLALLCQDDHPHLDWKPEFDDDKKNNRVKSYPTSDEAAYPFLLCQRLIASVKKKLFECGALEASNLLEQVETESTNSHQFVLGMLPRGKKYRQLVSEFSRYIDAIIRPGHDEVLEALQKPLAKGSKITNRQCCKWGQVRVDSLDRNFIDGSLLADNLSDEFVVEKVTIGVPRDPIDFCKRSFLAGHPRSIAIHLSQQVQEALKANFEEEPYLVAKKRAVFFQRWSARARELKPEEGQTFAILSGTRPKNYEGQEHATSEGNSFRPGVS